MAGHSHFANIKYKKEAQDKKRSKLFTRVQREIMVALRSGLPDPDLNVKLKSALVKARQYNLPKDKIEAVIKKGSGANDSDDYEEIRYNGYGPGGVAFVIETLTDNRNRTVGEVRAVFTKYGGSLAETGAVEFMFAKVGLLQYPISVMSFDEMFELAIEAGANDIESDEENYYIETGFTDLHECAGKISAKIGDSSLMQTFWKTNDMVDISEDHKVTIGKIISALEDLDDVQDVYCNTNIS